ncbi:MAG TPA: guanylate kinase [Actinomycetota bacterium]|nr:guanylate kinase [Actinomycetota bacterium]
MFGDWVRNSARSSSTDSRSKPVIRTGKLFVLAGPSGVGKGSIVRELVTRDPEGLSLSVSVTTRAPRPGEVDGVDYFFIDDDAFERMIRAGELLEWAEIVGHRSGTPRGFVEDRLAAGRDVVLEIDVVGASQVRERVPGSVLIYIEPPSMEELERRLRGRGTETEERIRLRLETAAWELEQRGWFDHVVVNDDLKRASAQVAAIIEASRSPS